MELKNKFIKNAKKAVDDLILILSADIDLDSVSDNTKGKKAIQVKKKAFIDAKKIISGVLDFDYKQQKWARKVVGELIASGSSSVEALIDALDASVSVNKIADNADDISNAISAKSIAFYDAMEIMEHVEELKRISEEEEIVIKEADFNQGFPGPFLLLIIKI